MTLRQQSCTLQGNFPPLLDLFPQDHSPGRNFTWKNPLYLLLSWAQRGLPSVSPHPPAPLSLLPQLLEKTQPFPKESTERGRSDAAAEVKSQGQAGGAAGSPGQPHRVRHTPPTAKRSRGSQCTVNFPAAITSGLLGSGSIPWFTPHPSRPGSLTGSCWSEQVVAPLALPTVPRQLRELLTATRSLKNTICPHAAPRPGESSREIVSMR